MQKSSEVNFENIEYIHFLFQKIKAEMLVHTLQEVLKTGNTLWKIKKEKKL